MPVSLQDVISIRFKRIINNDVDLCIVYVDEYLTNNKAEGSDCRHPDGFHLDDSVKVGSLAPDHVAAQVTPDPQSAAGAAHLTARLPHHELD